MRLRKLELITDLTRQTEGKIIMGWYEKNDTLYIRFQDDSQVRVVYNTVQCKLYYDDTADD